MNLSDVYLFKKVASTLSFTKAARQIGVSRSAASKQISRLEHDLGVVLINRNTRSVNLTEAGRIFDEHTFKIDSTIEHAAELVKNLELSPHGTVSITLPTSLSATLMPSLTTEFQARWPELRLNFDFDDTVRDIIAHNHDLAIRISKKLTDSSLISRRLTSTHGVLAASPQYLRENGVPQDLSDLKKHRCLGLGSGIKTSSTWRLQKHGKVADIPIQFALSANNNLTLILAACLNSGIIYVPVISIINELTQNQLQIIPCCVSPEPYGIYALYPHRNAASKVKILIDFIENTLTKAETLNRWTPLAEHVISVSDDVDALPHTKTGTV